MVVYSILSFCTLVGMMWCLSLLMLNVVLDPEFTWSKLSTCRNRTWMACQIRGMPNFHVDTRGRTENVRSRFVSRVKVGETTEVFLRCFHMFGVFLKKNSIGFWCFFSREWMFAICFTNTRRYRELWSCVWIHAVWKRMFGITPPFERQHVYNWL